MTTKIRLHSADAVVRRQGVAGSRRYWCSPRVQMQQLRLGRRCSGDCVNAALLVVSCAMLLGGVPISARMRRGQLPQRRGGVAAGGAATDKLPLIVGVGLKSRTSAERVHQ